MTDGPAGDLTLLLLGGGGHAAVVADAARSMQWQIAGCLDDDRDAGRSGMPRLGCIADFDAVLASIAGAVIVHAAIGDSTIRKQWLERTGTNRRDPIVHCSAVVSPSAVIRPGAFIGPLSVVNAGAVIGVGAIVNSGAIVEHDCVIGAYSHIAPNAVMAGGARTGEHSLIGCGASVLPGVSVGDGATVAAGAVVVSDIPAHVTAIGVPARVR